MKNQDIKAKSSLFTLNRHFTLKNSVSLIGGLSMLFAGNLAIAQTDSPQNSFIIPISPSAPPPAPVAAPAPAAAPAPVRVAPVAPAPVMSKPQKQVQLSAPRVSVPTPPRSTYRTPVTTHRPNRPAVTAPVSQTPEPAKNSYLDPTIYSKGATGLIQNETSVILTERSSGCRTTFNSGGANNSCAVTNNNPSPGQTSRTVASTPRTVTSSSRNSSLRVVSSNQAQINRRVSKSAPATYYVTQNNHYYNPNRVVPEVPVYYRAAQLQQGVNKGNTALLFPLSIPATITSAFGWRIHPITGQGRLHAGTDIAAPTGTPVLAAYPGQVSVASNLQGYGLTVMLRHLDDTQESRYAHLSEIFVEVGEWVEQGRVIGLVGSTGLSTGPHLHFEWRHLTASGWTAVDAGLHLEMAMENLIEGMKVASAKTDQ
jgi:murein DD-endopeptidase MepM/ murein hydrolase activator NlpD